MMFASSKNRIRHMVLMIKSLPDGDVIYLRHRKWLPDAKVPRTERTLTTSIRVERFAGIAPRWVVLDADSNAETGCRISTGKQ